MITKYLLQSIHLRELYVEALSSGWLELVKEIDAGRKLLDRGNIVDDRIKYEKALVSEDLATCVYVLETVSPEEKIAFAIRILEQLTLMPGHYIARMMQVFEKEGLYLENMLDIAIKTNNRILGLACIRLDKTLRENLASFPETALVKELKEWFVIAGE